MPADRWLERLDERMPALSATGPRPFAEIIRRADESAGRRGAAISAAS
jgi:hypothetical protein